MSSARPDSLTTATRSTQANNNMNCTLPESDFHTWGDSDSDKPKWRNLLTQAKHQLNVSNRNLITRIQFAQEVKTSSNRDKLESAIEETYDHNDFLAAATEMFEGVWQHENDKAEVETISQSAASMTAKTRADTTIAIGVLAAVTKSVADSEDRALRLGRQEDQRGGAAQYDEHHNDPQIPKVDIAHDLKPEQFTKNMGFLQLLDWLQRASVYAQASAISLFLF